MQNSKSKSQGKSNSRSNSPRSQSRTSRPEGNRLGIFERLEKIRQDSPQREVEEESTHQVPVVTPTATETSSAKEQSMTQKSEEALLDVETGSSKKTKKGSGSLSKGGRGAAEVDRTLPTGPGDQDNTGDIDKDSPEPTQVKDAPARPGRRGLKGPRGRGGRRYRGGKSLVARSSPVHVPQEENESKEVSSDNVTVEETNNPAEETVIEPVKTVESAGASEVPIESEVSSTSKEDTPIQVHTSVKSALQKLSVEGKQPVVLMPKVDLQPNESKKVESDVNETTEQTPENPPADSVVHEDKVDVPTEEESVSDKPSVVYTQPKERSAFSLAREICKIQAESSRKPPKVQREDDSQVTTKETPAASVSSVGVKKSSVSFEDKMDSLIQGCLRNKTAAPAAVLELSISRSSPRARKKTSIVEDYLASKKSKNILSAKVEQQPSDSLPQPENNQKKSPKTKRQSPSSTNAATRVSRQTTKENQSEAAPSNGEPTTAETNIEEKDSKETKIKDNDEPTPPTIAIEEKVPDSKERDKNMDPTDSLETNNSRIPDCESKVSKDGDSSREVGKEESNNKDTVLNSPIKDIALNSPRKEKQPEKEEQSPNRNSSKKSKSEMTSKERIAYIEKKRRKSLGFLEDVSSEDDNIQRLEDIEIDMIHAGTEWPMDQRTLDMIKDISIEVVYVGTGPKTPVKDHHSPSAPQTKPPVPEVTIKQEPESPGCLDSIGIDVVYAGTQDMKIKKGRPRLPPLPEAKPPSAPCTKTSQPELEVGETADDATDSMLIQSPVRSRSGRAIKLSSAAIEAGLAHESSMSFLVGASGSKDKIKTARCLDFSPERSCSSREHSPDKGHTVSEPPKGKKRGRKSAAERAAIAAAAAISAAAANGIPVGKGAPVAKDPPVAKDRPLSKVAPVVKTAPVLASMLSSGVTKGPALPTSPPRKKSPPKKKTIREILNITEEDLSVTMPPLARSRESPPTKLKPEGSPKSQSGSPDKEKGTKRRRGHSSSVKDLLCSDGASLHASKESNDNSAARGTETVTAITEKGILDESDIKSNVNPTQQKVEDDPKSEQESTTETPVTNGLSGKDALPRGATDKLHALSDSEIPIQRSKDEQDQCNDLVADGSKLQSRVQTEKNEEQNMQSQKANSSSNIPPLGDKEPHLKNEDNTPLPAYVATDDKTPIESTTEQKSLNSVTKERDALSQPQDEDRMDKASSEEKESRIESMNSDTKLDLSKDKPESNEKEKDYPESVEKDQADDEETVDDYEEEPVELEPADGKKNPTLLSLIAQVQTNMEPENPLLPAIERPPLGEEEEEEEDQEEDVSMEKEGSEEDSEDISETDSSDADDSTTDDSDSEESVTDDSKLDESVTDDSKTNENIADVASKTNESVADAVKSNDGKSDEKVTDDSKIEESVTEESKVDDSLATEDQIKCMPVEQNKAQENIEDNSEENTISVNVTESVSRKVEEQIESSERVEEAIAGPSGESCHQKIDPGESSSEERDQSGRGGIEDSSFPVTVKEEVDSGEDDSPGGSPLGNAEDRARELEQQLKDLDNFIHEKIKWVLTSQKEEDKKKDVVEYKADLSKIKTEDESGSSLNKETSGPSIKAELKWEYDLKPSVSGFSGAGTSSSSMPGPSSAGFSKPNPHTLFEITGPEGKKKVTAFSSEELDQYLTKNCQLSKKCRGDEQFLKHPGAPVQPAPSSQSRTPSKDPDVDEVDGVVFHCFSSKRSLQEFIKNGDCPTSPTSSLTPTLLTAKRRKSDTVLPVNTSFSTPGFSSSSSSFSGASFSEDHNKTPEKTHDVTKIKGWQKKYSPGGGGEGPSVQTSPGGSAISPTPEGAINSLMKIHWRTKERLLRNLTPDEIQTLGLSLKRRRRKVKLLSHKKGAKRLQMQQQQQNQQKKIQASSSAEANTYGGRMRPPVMPHRKPLCPTTLTSSQVLSAISALKVNSRTGASRYATCFRPGM